MSAPAVRVLRVIARLNVGGPARHVTLLNRGLEQRGHSTLLVHGSPGLEEGSLEELAAGLPAVAISHLGRRLKVSSDFRAFAQLVRIVFRIRPDVVHTHTAKAGTLGRLAAALYNLTRPRARRAAVIHTFHGHVFEGYFGTIGNLLVRLAERTLAKLTDRIITLSPAQKHDVTNRFAICGPGKVAVVPLGLDLEPLLARAELGPSLKQAVGIDDDATVIGYVGRFAPVKDLPLLFGAFREFLRTSPGAHLVLAGDGPLGEELRVMAAHLGIAPNVHFIGWCDDLPRLYATFDVVVLTSRNEGTPVALIEAMAAGVPVVATAVGGIVDIVQDDVTGVLVRTRTPQAVAAAIRTITTNPERSRQLAADARRHVRQRFGADQLVDEIEALYRRELSRLRPS